MARVSHGDVILQLIQDYQSFNASTIEHRHSPPTALQFARILHANRPVVFNNAISHWPALQKWGNPEYLRRLMGDQMITVAETPNGKADSIIDGYFVEPYQRTMPFGEMLDWLLSRQKPKDRVGNIRYVQSQNGNLSDEFERLRPDILELGWAHECLGEAPDASNVWIGNDESTTSLHLDHYENLYCQIVGCKTFYLVPPTEYACLKEKRFPSARWVPSSTNPQQLEIEPDESGLSVPWLTTDPSSLDPDSSDPLLRKCKPLIVTLQPGQVLYLPALWFHSVFQTPSEQGLCVAVNYWYDMDFTGPLYPLFNFVRHSTMIEEGRHEDILLDTDN